MASIILNGKNTSLSKSRYMCGRQCSKKLWQTVYDPEPAEAPLPGTVMGMGIEVGIKARLRHQASFRDAVLSAYRGRCAICHLPEPRLLDAAHIIMDADEQLGQPVISNGLPLTMLHHAAFDAHLIGIDPDYQIHVSDPIGCSKSMMGRFSTSALRGSPGH